ncbi:hypothetical protein CLV24_104164 [Pontibacter ummariensis]|uniref:Chromosome segregation ATPase n=1 Tax=Pontibacter ummariensis TaxID=1610492 RepID=A0A239DDH3_9BACT|nr:hypothetical protein [Pontibacter ummariensis]PRY14354.1 hypothetical protein CLV24_104164 [Pontibacter ummariensis]SNS29961.1 hypothetical protein SAMN06296052_104163 [Pontibacter ummariensis]
MADEQNRSVMLRIDINEGEYRKKIISLQKDILQTKKEEQQLAKAIKESGEASDEQIEKQVELKAKLKDLNKEQRLAQATLEAKTRADKAAAGSMEQMSLALSEMKKEYRALSKEERESELGKKMQQDMKALNDELKDLEQSYGQFGRSVGDYTGGILQAVDGTGLLATITDKATQAQQAYQATLTLTKNALGGNISMLKAFKLAMAATGIGAVVLLLGGLVSWLTRTQEGIDKVNQVTKSITTVLGFLGDRLSDVGKATIDWFKDIHDLGDFLEKLGTEIIGNVTTRLKGFLTIWEGFKSGDTTKIQDGIAQVSLGIENATAKAKGFAKEVGNVAVEAARIEKEFQRIEKAEIALNKERSKSRREIKELNFIVEDQTKTEKERAAAAEKALAIEQGLLQKQIKLQQDKVAAIRAEQKLTYNGNDEDRALAEAEAALDELQESSLEMQTTMNNKLNQLNKEAVAKRVALAKELSEKEQEERKRRIEDEKAGLELLVLQTAEGSKERLEAKLELAKKEMEIELSNKELTERQKQVIQARFDQQELAARKEFAEKLVAVAKETAEKEAAARKLHAEQILQEAQANVERNVAQRQYEADRKAEIAQAEFETVSMLAGSLGDIAQLMANQSEESANFQKALALFQIGIASAEAITKGIAASQDVPFPGNLVAMASTIATVTANLLRAKQLLSSGDAPQAPQFYEGGYTGDGAPTAVAGIVHKGEYVLTAKMVKQNPELVEKLERMRTQRGVTAHRIEAAGLRGYATGGLVTGPTYQLPAATREFLAGAPAPAIDYDRLARAMAKLPAPVTRISDIKGSLAKDVKTNTIANQ